MSVIKSIKMIILSIIYGAGMILVDYMFEYGTLQYTIAGRIYAELELILVLMLYPAKKKGAIFLWPTLCIFNVMLGSLTLIIYNALAIPLDENFFMMTIIPQLLIYLLTILTCKILIITNYIKYLKILLDYPRMCMFLFVSHFGVTIYFFFSERNSIRYLTAMFVFAITIFIFILTTRDFLNKEKIKQNEALILQQDHYVRRLENIQQELRIIQHDYKNMISSLYAQASDGDSDSIKSYIETKLIGVDATVQENINQMNQVSKIELSELKGLVLTKMIEAEQNGVLLKIEAMNKVSGAEMDINDLIRCIGILLDNAIEAAQHQDKSEVTLVLLSEPDKFTAAVKNPILRKPDLSKIWQQGYSTKGENRGLGLTSYKKILNKYANTSSETKVSNHAFLQVLLISNIKKSAI
ncbi:MAG: sensor histidine kinase [Lachnospiraceae bacterium]